MMFLPSTGFSGVNMSFKARTTEDFVLPCVTLRGIGNERALAVHMIKKGFHTIYTQFCPITHLEKESLSRTTDKYIRLANALEYYVQPYLVDTYQKINVDKLKRFCILLGLYSRMRHSGYSKAVLRGLSISVKAIEEEWKPNKVRDTIRKTVEDFKDKHRI